MVFFTCNACGESLKKAQVDKHVNMCRGCQVLSCIDCGKDFWGDDYKNHNKCISEDQKYGGKGYEAKTNKGDVKQQEWIQKIHEAMNKPGVGAKLRDVLRQVSTYDNVPRKKAKFQNWMRNSLKISNVGLHEEVWNVLAAADAAPEAARQSKENQESAVDADTNGAERQDGRLAAEKKKKKMSKRECKEARRGKSGKTAAGGETVAKETGKKKKKDRKRKCQDEDEEQNENGVEDEIYAKKAKVDQQTDAGVEETDETEDPAVQGKFNWKGTIKAALRESPDQELSVKKLRKKILAAYYSFTGDGNFKSEEEVFALFNKKINKNPKLRVLKDRVRLLK